MKIATLTPTPMGGLPWALAAIGLVLTACPTADDSSASATNPTESSDDDSESETEPATTDPMTDTDGTTTMTTMEESSGAPTTSETTGPQPEGLGCGVTPTCDKGEMSGSLVYEGEASIEELAGYTSVTGWVQVIATDVVCLDFLSCITTVGKAIEVSDNPNLQSVRGLSNVTTAEDVTIFQNNSLTSLAGFDNLTEIQIISISNNGALVDLDGFPATDRISTSLSISENPVLTTISGFNNLVVIENEINVQFNPVLTDLSGLSGLLALGGQCIITNNETLCVSQAATVCGDLQDPPAKEGPPPGSTANNDDSC